ncbi:MAG: ABC transporter ATP-binding protein [Candidatus Limnocylindria bacterium]
MAGISLDAVTKVYSDGTRAISSLDLEVPDGSLMVLVGPSGCGKTTALMMVAGLEDVTEGTIRIGDRIVNDEVPKDRDIAMVFQNYALYPHMSVYRNMAFALKIQRVDGREIDRRVREAARILELTDDLLEKKPKQLSGGQRQRVAMGRAIVRQPQAFLMDEPLSNLDAKLRVEMRAEISRLQRELGVTTIYVTHDQTEAMTLGNLVAVLHDGVLKQVGPPQDVYDRPADLFVAGFMGSPAMNLAEAELTLADGGAFVEFAQYRLRLADDAVAERPALAARDGRKVVVGIRPEDMEDASIVDGVPVDRRMKAVVEMREAMGPEAYVHFRVPVPSVARAPGGRVADSTTNPNGGQGTKFVARVRAQTRANDGDRIELAVDTASMHFFDPESGDRI